MIRGIALVALLLACGAARAESPVEREAKQHFLAGQKHFDSARWGEALVEFDQSYRLSGYPALVYKIALCQDQLGQSADALASYEKYLRDDPKSERRAGIEDRIAKIRILLAPPEKPAPPSSVTPPVEHAATAAPAPEHRPATPVYKRWWLWTVVGAVAAGGVAIGLGVGLTQGGVQHEPGWSPDFVIGPPQALVTF